MVKLKSPSDEPEVNTRTDDDDYNIKFTQPNLKGDWINILLLIVLYVMQGLPLGIYGAIPVLVQSNKNVTYSDQAILSFSGYPFSLKILWAPLVDALYVQKFGRRKSWLIPTQYLIGIILAYVAWEIDNLLHENEKPNIIMLTSVFCLLHFLVSVQDVVVDGWSLTMLKKNNVCYASVCNMTGQVIGILLGNMPLILFTSEDFCNKYLRATPVLGGGGILTLKTIICGWSILLITVTTLVALLKREKDCTLEENFVKINVLQNYSLLWYILKLPSFQILALILVTMKIGFATANVQIMTLKLIDAGISKDVITMISSSLSTVNVLLPIAIAKLISRSKAMNVFLHSIILRLPMNVVFALFIYYTPFLLTQVNGSVHIPMYYYVILVIVFLIQNITHYAMAVPMVYFFSQISDARFGGTYITLLNTLINFGQEWTTTSALALLEVFTFNGCLYDSQKNCCTTDLLKTCDENQGKFKRIVVDGYYVEMLLCTVIGIVWYFVFKKQVKSLQTKSASDWMVNVKNSTTGKVNIGYSMDESPF